MIIQNSNLEIEDVKSLLDFDQKRVRHELIHVINKQNVKKITKPSTNGQKWLIS